MQAGRWSVKFMKITKCSIVLVKLGRLKALCKEGDVTTREMNLVNDNKEEL